jgi:hypothetical protein
MTRSRSFLRRTRTSWAIRIALAVGVAAIGYGAVAHSLAYALRSRAIARAHALAPDDGRITASLSEKLSGPEVGPAERAKSDLLAREALKRDPTAVAAVATLGINAEVRGDTTSARRLFAYSLALSRRDFRTQIWSVEDAARRGDIPGALRAYDIALRTSRLASNVMFPVLASAISDPSILSATVKTLTAKPGWTESFIEYVSLSGPSPRATANLFRELRRVHVPVSDQASAAVLNGMISTGLLDEAWSYYASIRPGADRRMSRDSRFTETPDAPSFFDWVAVNDEPISTSIARGQQHGVFDFSVPSSIGGELLKQMQLLPPGGYLIEGHSAGIDQPEGSRPYWTLRCPDGRELGRVAMPNSSVANGAFSGRFDVPANCPVQSLSLIARPSDSVSGVSGQIDRALLHSIR